MKYPKLKLKEKINSLKLTDDKAVVLESEKLKFTNGFVEIRHSKEDSNRSTVWTSSSGKINLSKSYDWIIAKDELGYLELVGVQK